MEAKELMIGDWVYLNYWDGKFVQQLHGINYNSWRGEGYSDWVDTEIDDEASIDNIEPIPLIPEILEKNGFVKVNSQRYRWGELCGNILFHVDVNPKKGYFYITNESHKNHANVYDSFYVHRLQHALRLCGLNNLADNFKV